MKTAASLILCASAMILGAQNVAAERIDKGARVIQGTSVDVVIYHERGYAVFSNFCGSQRLTQGELQAGAIPNEIIPCPRPDGRNRYTDPPRQTTPQVSPPSYRSDLRQYYGAIAIVYWTDSNGGRRVTYGMAWNFSTENEANNDAVRRCQQYSEGNTCQVSYRFWNGGCGYISVSSGRGNCAGTASTAQEAYDYCRSRGCNCKPAVGHCTSSAQRIE